MQYPDICTLHKMMARRVHIIASKQILGDTCMFGNRISDGCNNRSDGKNQNESLETTTYGDNSNFRSPLSEECNTKSSGDGAKQLVGTYALSQNLKILVVIVEV